jgi:ribosomal protein S18 acetylase RimI-like enzyme
MIMNIRSIAAKDREVLTQILRLVGNFSEQEIGVAIELIDDAISEYSSGDYIACVLEDEKGQVQGYACYGLTPLTESTYDFYWMAVHPDAQGNGYGRSLIRFVEQDVREKGGRLLVLETSSQENYTRTRLIYEKYGYELVARVRDFYKKNDDKLIYVKYL